VNCPTKFPGRLFILSSSAQQQELDLLTVTAETDGATLPLEVAPEVGVVWSQDACRLLPVAQRAFF